MVNLNQDRGKKMQTFQMKDVPTVEAMQWNDTDADREAFAKWFDEYDTIFETRGPILVLENGPVDPGDWAVLHMDGEFYSYSSERFLKKFVEVKNATSSKLVAHAEYELKRAGLFEKDSDYDGAIGDDTLELIRVFAQQGHSGGSASRVRELFQLLANYKALVALTSAPDEWRAVEGFEKPTLQSTRQSSCFSQDGGRTFVDHDEKCPDGVDFMVRRTKWVPYEKPHEFEPDHSGSPNSGPPDETCLHCGYDPRNILHDAVESTDG